MGSILTAQQQQALSLLADTELAKDFYLSGGTALSEYYLQHRKSEDLGFFNMHEFEATSVTAYLKSFKPKLDYISLDFQKQLNRNLYFLRFNDGEVLKLEFTYFPFEQIEEPESIDGIRVDSLVDIAVNKLFTIVQNPRGRDYYDFLAIIEHKRYEVENLRMLAKQKFDWHVDPLQLAARFNEVSSHLDDPILIASIERQEVIDFFEQRALDMREEILE